MTVKLIPVLKIEYHDQRNLAPGNRPYWEHFSEWDKYHADCFLKAGFENHLIPYLPGSSFYLLKDIAGHNLIQILKDHTADFIAGKYNLDEVSPLMGGYVLNIKNEDVYFPQCCGDLTDINFWENLCNGNVSFYAGHPEPEITIIENRILFNFDVHEFGEPFAPPPKFNVVEINISDLKDAIIDLKIELGNFATLVNQINNAQQLNIADIDKLLIWGDN
jgi:hypothetical protein